MLFYVTNLRNAILQTLFTTYNITYLQNIAYH